MSWELDDAPYFLFSFFPWFATHLDVADEWRRLQVERGTWDAPATATASPASP